VLSEKAREGRECPFVLPCHLPLYFLLPPSQAIFPPPPSNFILCLPFPLFTSSGAVIARKRKMTTPTRRNSWHFDNRRDQRAVTCTLPATQLTLRPRSSGGRQDRRQQHIFNSLPDDSRHQSDYRVRPQPSRAAIPTP